MIERGGGVGKAYLCLWKNSITMVIMARPRAVSSHMSKAQGT